MTFKTWLAWREGLLAPDKAPAPGLPRFNATCRTNAERKKLVPKKVRMTPVGAPPAPTIRRVGGDPFPKVPTTRIIQGDGSKL